MNIAYPSPARTSIERKFIITTGAWHRFDPRFAVKPEPARIDSILDSGSMRYRVCICVSRAAAFYALIKSESSNREI